MRMHERPLVAIAAGLLMVTSAAYGEAHRNGPLKTPPHFSVAHRDESMVALVKTTDHKALAVWAMKCAERVMPCFEQKYPADHRPRAALEALQAWIHSGVFTMAVIRRASLTAHAAARETGEDNAARSAARAAGQAVATAHVSTHSMGAARYALQAVYRAADPADAEAATARERRWQLARLQELSEQTEME